MLNELSLSKEVKEGRNNMTSSSSSPFRMPSNILESAMQKEEERRQERRMERTLNMHEKGVNPRESVRSIMSRCMKEIEDEEHDKKWKESTSGEAAYFAPSTKFVPLESEFYHMGTSRDFIEKQEEIVRLQCCIIAGREKIQALKEQMSLQEEEMAQAEYRCRDEVFSEYVEEVEKKTVLGLKRVEEENEALRETKQKIEKTKWALAKVKKDVAERSDMLSLDKQCQELLWNISPPEWRKQQEARKQTAERIKAAARETKPATQATRRRRSDVGLMLPPIQESHHGIFFNKESCTLEKIPEYDEGFVGNLEVYEKPQIYFTDPKQLLNIMADVDADINRLSDDLSRVEHCLECHKKNMSNLQQDMEKDTAQSNEETDYLTRCMNKKRAKAAKIEQRIKEFKMSEDGPEQKNAVLKQLNQKISELYRVCVGDLPDMSSHELLTAVETHFHDLLERFNTLPEDELKTIKKEYRREKTARDKKQKELMVQMDREERRLQRAARRQQRALERR
ncbi:cilia- and flagella-associated protein 100-like isoform X1 [Ictalurus furcatus]|uniref:cilia- and flagella-associated protein 100-like isoform X1 n=1 Tax=Ictalurus furcatus TaxID=66913 RepID=UPI00235002D8|nr:cilia- and flagella-associated protein 100-like isoform X1 [Ictalurus furcatus]